MINISFCQRHRCTITIYNYLEFYPLQMYLESFKFWLNLLLPTFLAQSYGRKTQHLIFDGYRKKCGWIFSSSCFCIKRIDLKLWEKASQRNLVSESGLYRHNSGSSLSLSLINSQALIWSFLKLNLTLSLSNWYNSLAKIEKLGIKRR